MLKYVLVTLIPWIELRGAIPLAIKSGNFAAIPPIFITNILIFFPIYFGLELFYKHLKENSRLKKRLEKIKKKAHPYIQKYGVPGLVLFVGIPLPGTGVYSGSAAAWLLGLKWKPSLCAICGGVTMASFLVFVLSMGILSSLLFL